jgi:hypothetical protein
MDFDALWSPFVSWQFGVAAMVIIAILATLKKILRQIGSTVAEKGWFKVCMTVANLVLGLLVAIPKDFLLGNTYWQRALVGVCAGFLSNYIYTLLIKRLLPRPSEIGDIEDFDPDKAINSAKCAAVDKSEDITQVVVKTDPKLSQ